MTHYSLFQAMQFFSRRLPFIRYYYFPPDNLFARQLTAQYHCTALKGYAAIVRSPNPTKVGAAPIAVIILSTTATPTAPIEHRTRLLIAVLLAPFPGQRSVTNVWLIAKTALLVALMRNWKINGIAIQPGRFVNEVSPIEIPYAIVLVMNTAVIQGMCFSLAFSMGKSTGNECLESFSLEGISCSIRYAASTCA